MCFQYLTISCLPYILLHFLWNLQTRSLDHPEAASNTKRRAERRRSRSPLWRSKNRPQEENWARNNAFLKSGGDQLIVINYQFSSGFSCWSLPFIFHSAFKEVGEGFGYFTYILKYSNGFWRSDIWDKKTYDNKKNNWKTRSFIV